MIIDVHLTCIPKRTLATDAAMLVRCFLYPDLVLRRGTMFAPQLLADHSLSTAFSYLLRTYLALRVRSQGVGDPLRRSTCAH